MTQAVLHSLKSEGYQNWTWNSISDLAHDHESYILSGAIKKENYVSSPTIIKFQIIMNSI